MPPKKRSYSDVLTGGTNDVSPQFYVVRAQFDISPGAGAFLSVGSPVPIPRYTSGIDKAIVMEILSTEIQWVDPPNTVTTAANDNVQAVVALTTDPVIPSTMEGIVGSPRVISLARRNIVNNGVQAGAQEWVLEEYDNLTDQAGHGVLVATDNIYVVTGGSSVGYVWSSAVYIKILYRMKEVKLTEYIGIVQSQQ